ncbi:DUF1588 domain-containing protein [Planctomicrobium sp. SH664]|uniref:DUF1588 domain-containing protein n=1 Tax=Planctomicrobium sp. SH664 TaxID=3448125 RepID=UPI003F5B67F7
MLWSRTLLKSGVLFFLLAGAPRVEAGLGPEPENYFPDRIRPLLVKYCGDCHHPDDLSNHVQFLTPEFAQGIGGKRTLWNSVAAQLFNRTMPPASEVQPSEQERMEIAHWINNTLRATACDQGDYAGAVVARRLNLREYERTIRDLIGLRFDFSETFPADGGGGEGFDNNGETLYLPPMLMEKYVESAQRILETAIDTPPMQREFPASEFVSELGEQSEAGLLLPPGAEAGVLISLYRNGKSIIQLRLTNRESLPSQLELLVDDLPVNSQQVVPGKQSISAELQLTRGLHTLKFRNQQTGQPIVIQQLTLREAERNFTPQQQLAHQRIMGAAPGSGLETRDEAQRIIAAFAERGFRRPVAEEVWQPYLKLYDRATERGDPYPERIKLALKGILVSPRFLMRIEEPPARPGIHPLDDYELASRLSYFLWGTMPDEELLQLAREGKLQREDVLMQQVDRLLDSDHALAFMEDFMGQWLGTREVGRRVIPERPANRDIINRAIVDLRDQPVYLWKFLLDHNRSILELIDADYVIANTNVARYYQLQDVDGTEFVPVPDPERLRSGVLGMAAVHLVTSNATRTSPVLRGAWVLETLLGTPVPSPPPDIPPLKPKNRTSNVTVRDELLAHRDSPACAACHNIIDPIGFALENYDLVGQWRDSAGGQAIDSSGVMPDGEAVNGPADLKRVLLKRQPQYVRHFTQKLLGYALGRSLLDQDACTIERIADRLQANDYRARQLVKEIVLSVPFRSQQLVHADGSPVLEPAPVDGVNRP